jgi:hypothetical protein
MAIAMSRTTSQIIIISLIRMHSFLVVLSVYYKTHAGAMNFFEKGLSGATSLGCSQISLSICALLL